MFRSFMKYAAILKNRYNHIESDLEGYNILAQQVMTIDFAEKTDQELIQISENLRRQARQGVNLYHLLVDAYALIQETIHRVLGLKLYPVQMIAGIALDAANIIEMQTGEGKTLAAVAPAYLNALGGQGVHILTFNDYLAQRDEQWMGPVYQFLGLKTAHIIQGMDMPQRQRAYQADITYISAKEAGFDFLRDSISMERSHLVHRELNYVIIDEADSILIDEARVPLIIAGSSQKFFPLQTDYQDLVKKLREDHHYIIDAHNNNVYLTDAGIRQTEVILKIKNLYDEGNLEHLTGINCALYAQFLLQRDKDYIVRNSRIELVDVFTGRVAEKRKWPDGIQAAVEAKENILQVPDSKVLGSMTLQHYLSLYPKLAGMTGTAATSAREIHEFYSRDVTVIPSHKKCIRKDHPPFIFIDRQGKMNAMIADIGRIHQRNQPILIGTSSVQESEVLAIELKKEGINCQVLNARNDWAEAEIIAQAGRPGAVTVSTNMAGRGVDIKLGGENEQDREKVVGAGGLYIIGTTLSESRRVDNQLRGRAGRQGEPGECRFYISLEDEWAIKYHINELLPPIYQTGENEQVTDPVMAAELARGQRIVEGYFEDIRRQLWKYSSLVEQQRRIIHHKRKEILVHGMIQGIFVSKAPDRYNQLLGTVGKTVLNEVERKLALFYLNYCWAEYLDYISYIRDTIHLVVIGKKNPLDEFNRFAIEAFDEMLNNVEKYMVDTFCTADITQHGIDLEKEGLQIPAATWTYLIDDSPAQFSNLTAIMKAAANVWRKSID